MTSNVRIDIASEFSDKGFKAAEKATSQLDKSIAKLSKRLTGAFSAYKIAQFGKDSVKAFAADQKAAAVLAKTLENVNQGYATDMVNAYIAKTEALYGVLDDKLRPAFAQLVVATGDATKSQALLQTALDVSAGTGKDLESVTAALSKAYLGNVTALQRLGVGLSAADLKGKSFNDIITILNQNFAGQAATAADTYGGKLDRLNVAFENMKETIGKGIIDALGQLNSSEGFNGVINKMGTLAQDISDIIVGIGVIAQKLQSLPGIGVLGDILKFNIEHGLLGILKNLGAAERVKSSQPSVVTNFLKDMNKIAAATAKSNGNATKLLSTTKALTKEQRDQLALKQASLKLEQAKSVFDLDRIQLAAAAKTATGEDLLRIKLKQDIIALEDAIQAKNADLATKLAEVVSTDQQRLVALMAQNVQLEKMKGLYDQIISKDVVINFTSNGLGAILNAQGALTGRGNVVIPNETGGSVAGSSTGGSTTSSSVAGAVASAGKAASAAAAAASSAASSVASVADAVVSSNKTSKDTKDAITTITNTVPSIPDAVSSSVGNAVSNAIDERQQAIFDASKWATFFGLTDFTASGISSVPSVTSGNYIDTSGRPADVKVTIVDNTSGLIDVITNATQQATANGISLRVARNTGGWD